MERETHCDNDEHIINIPNGEEDSSSGSSLDEGSNYFTSRSSLSMDEEASDEGATSSTSCSGYDTLWNSMELVFTLVQIVVALVVLTLGKDEHPHALLLAWLIGYTCGCIISTLLTLFWFLRKYNQVTEYQTTSDSTDGMMKDLKMGLHCFFVVWLILLIVWICDGHSSPSDAPKLYKLSIVFIAFICISFAAFLLYYCADFVREGQGGGFVIQEPIPDDCCSICLGKYGEKEEVIRKLECSHIFHLKCINEWLRIKPTCPLCQSLVRG